MKQLRDEEIVQKVIDRGDGYFHWLQDKSGLSGPLSSMLADTEFRLTNKLDTNLLNCSKEDIRQAYAEYIKEKDELDDKETEKIYKSIRGDCCLFEVILRLAVAVNEMVNMSSNDRTAVYFGKMMENAGFDLYDEEDWDMRPDDVKGYWQKCIDRILDRTYSDAGGMGLFPLKPVDGKTYSDRRTISLWQQMNDWVDQNTNEDGEWIG